jgi:hypothetical protein
MRSIRARLTRRGRYILSGVLALGVIAAVVIVAINRIGSIAPASLPTASPLGSTFPYSSGGSLATHARQAARYAITNPQAPRVTASNGALTVTGIEKQAPGTVQNFDGINAAQDLHVNAYDNDPPDQGLCVNASLEYIPPGAATPNENWGTRILEIAPTA